MLLDGVDRIAKNLGNVVRGWRPHTVTRLRGCHEIDAGSNSLLRLAAADCVGALKDLYRDQLQKAAKFVRYFELRDRNDRVVYYLFFASNNAKGHYKMKEAMWKVNPLGDFSFSDATNPNQEILFLNPSLESLKSGLVKKFRPLGQVPIEHAETYVFEETGFLRKHMRKVLLQLESQGQVEIAALKSDGNRRRRNTYPKDALISFL